MPCLCERCKRPTNDCSSRLCEQCEIDDCRIDPEDPTIKNLKAGGRFYKKEEKG
jgi:hypothetical protein